MFASFAVPFNWLRSGVAYGKDVMKLPSVTVQDVETSTDRRARTLKHLLKANHANHSIIYHNLQFHNHAPHVGFDPVDTSATCFLLTKLSIDPRIRTYHGR